MENNEIEIEFDDIAPQTKNDIRVYDSKIIAKIGFSAGFDIHTTSYKEREKINLTQSTFVPVRKGTTARSGTFQRLKRTFTEAFEKCRTLIMIVNVEQEKNFKRIPVEDETDPVLQSFKFELLKRGYTFN